VRAVGQPAPDIYARCGRRALDNAQTHSNPSTASAEQATTVVLSCAKIASVSPSHS